MKHSRGIFILLMVAIVPCLLCSGMAGVVAGPEFGIQILGIILVLYLVIASIWLVTWLAIDSWDSGSRGRDDNTTVDTTRDPSSEDRPRE